MKKIKAIAFGILFGVLAGLVVWAFIKLMSLSMFFLWEWLPNKVNIYLLRIAICAVGGALIGLFRKKVGDYPDEMTAVMAKVKTEKFYDYKKLPIIFFGALMPIVIGSSVGPEAGLVGIIVALCYLVRDGVGLNKIKVHKAFRIFIYVLTTITALGVLVGLNKLSGHGMEGFPHARASAFNLKDALMSIVYIVAGILLGLFYEVSHSGCHIISNKIPAILKETIAGVVLGLFGCMLPMLMFSGEEELGVLFSSYSMYAPLLLIALAFLKVVLTNICIQFGLKGGHFFPLIFAAACLGYGIAMLAFPDSVGHVTFAAAMVCGSTLGVTLKKPIAITLILCLCFPIMYIPGIFLASFLATFLANKINSK